MGSVEGNELGTPAPHKLEVRSSRQRIVCLDCLAHVVIHGNFPVQYVVELQAEHNRQLGLEYRQYIPVQHSTANVEFDCHVLGTDTDITLNADRTTLYIKVE